MYPGTFIVIEGIDGSGKSTQARLLADHVRRHCEEECWLTTEPSKGPVGRFLRKEVLSGRSNIDEYATCLLFAADRQDHLTKEILPALERGEIVVCDRYVLSTLVYQALDDLLNLGSQSTSRSPTVREVRAIHGEFLKSDLTLYIQTSPEEAARRLSHRSSLDRYENLDKLRTLDWGYREAIRLFHGLSYDVVTVDGDRSSAAVAEEILDVVKRFLASRRPSYEARGT